MFAPNLKKFAQGVTEISRSRDLDGFTDNPENETRSVVQRCNKNSRCKMQNKVKAGKNYEKEKWKYGI